jgi:hypothetical protein
MSIIDEIIKTEIDYHEKIKFLLNLKHLIESQHKLDSDKINKLFSTNLGSIEKLCNNFL